VEAKRQEQYTKDKIINECHEACENRDAQVAISFWHKEFGEQNINLH